MHYEVQSAMKSGRPLTPAQRTSSLFSEAPVVLGVTLRRGVVHRLSPEQVTINRSMLERLLKAQAIELVEVDGKVRIPIDFTTLKALESWGKELPQDASAVVDSLPDAGGEGADDPDGDMPAGGVLASAGGSDAPAESATVSQQEPLAEGVTPYMTEELPGLVTHFPEETIKQMVQPAPEKTPEQHAPKGKKKGSKT